MSTTKPGSLLKQAIPIRTFADWDDKRAGFEVDLVAHCDDDTSNEYLHTPLLTDVATAWTEVVALPNRGQKAVSEAIQVARARLPFPLLGLDSDNGGEFINDNLARYCKREGISFTRSRPYKKNDQAYVEQKNWTVVRQMVGYDRYEGPQAVAQLEALYDVLRPYVNFLQPVMKLTSKERFGSKVAKNYDVSRARPTSVPWVYPRRVVRPRHNCSNIYRSTPPSSYGRSMTSKNGCGVYAKARSVTEATNHPR